MFAANGKPGQIRGRLTDRKFRHFDRDPEKLPDLSKERFKLHIPI